MNNKSTPTLGTSEGLALSQWSCLEKCTPCRKCEWQNTTLASPGAPIQPPDGSGWWSGGWQYKVTYTGYTNTTTPVTGVWTKCVAHAVVYCDSAHIGSNANLGFCEPSLHSYLTSLGFSGGYGFAFGGATNLAMTIDFLSEHFVGTQNGEVPVPSWFWVYNSNGVDKSAAAAFTGIPIRQADYPPAGFTFDVTFTATSGDLTSTGANPSTGGLTIDLLLNRMMPNNYAPFRKRIRVPLVGVPA